MNIIRNEKLIRRNARLASITMIGSLLILAGGMYVSFSQPDQFGLSLAALSIGFILSQVGIFFSNRWGRKPRPDELLDQSLKGLDNKYSLIHYNSPVSHLLIGPAGLWVLIPYYQRGTITFSKGRWRQKGGNFYLKLFAQENLGRPELEVLGEMERLRRFLNAEIPSEEPYPIQAALVFTNPRAVIDISDEEEPPAETVPVSKLKPLIRAAAKSKPISADKLKQIQDMLTPPEPNDN